MTIKPASTVLMIRPVRFGFNSETAASNAFQQDVDSWSAAEIQDQAQDEFDGFVRLLRAHEIEVLVYEDTEEPLTPDSIFPNNWFSTHPKGHLFVYPMATENRAREVRNDILEDLQRSYAFTIDRDLLAFGSQERFLEGTGSLLLDPYNQLAYAALSPRTHKEVLDAFAAKTGYRIIPFEALGPSGEKIYHTNVMLCLADDFALIGLDTLVEKDRERIQSELETSGKEIIALTNEQVYNHFAGNMLQLQGKNGKKYLIMSANAKASLNAEQLERIAFHKNEILAPDLETIETIGGGSARCMLAEIFIPQ